MTDRGDGAAYERRLVRILIQYVIGLCVVLGLLALAERHGLSRQWLGPSFLFATVMVYAAIGIYGRTTDAEEYYVAGRRIPPFFNGMATAADWMSAASFISLAGGLYLQGFSGSPSQPGGLAYVLGWTGGFCLVALLVAPYLRSLGLYTVPDYFQQRFGGRWPRILAAVKEIESWTLQREKVLVFGVFLRPLRLLRDVLNVRFALRAADVGKPIAHAVDTDAALLGIQQLIRDRTKRAVTTGYGPRFLHSTGQLHKGGAPIGCFIQLTADYTADDDVEIPGWSETFAALIGAQAAGDREVVVARRKLRGGGRYAEHGGQGEQGASLGEQVLRGEGPGAGGVLG